MCVLFASTVVCEPLKSKFQGSESYVDENAGGKNFNLNSYVRTGGAFLKLVHFALRNELTASTCDHNLTHQFS